MLRTGSRPKSSRTASLPKWAGRGLCWIWWVNVKISANFGVSRREDCNVFSVNTIQVPIKI
jgi:hypothetical protein